MAQGKILGIQRNGYEYTLRQIKFLLVELREYLSGLAEEELTYKEVPETNAYRLKLVKGMPNRILDTHVFEVLRTYDFLSDYLEKLSFEKEKRVKYGLIPIDGSDWEPANDGRPSIGPRLDTTEVFEEGTGYV